MNLYYFYDKNDFKKLCKNLFILLTKQNKNFDKLFLYCKNTNQLPDDLLIILTHDKIKLCTEFNKKDLENKIVIKNDIDIDENYLKDRYDIINYKEKNKIIGALTSWEKRIGNCYEVIYNMLYNQSVTLDKLYLTLSTDEFKNKEADLPADLVSLSEVEDRFEINWIKENTKCMKAVFPILEKISDDDIILKMDDDIMYPEDYIENRIDDYLKSKLPLTADRYEKWELVACGPSMLYTKHMLKNYDIFINDEILKANNEDSTTSAILYLNGYKLKIAKKYNKACDFTQHFVFNPIEASADRNEYLIYEPLKKLIFTRIEDITKKTFIDSYGFWKK